MGSREIKGSRAMPMAGALAMLALLGLAVSLPATSAGAKSTRVVLPGQTTAELALPRAGGFKLAIAASEERAGDVVTVSVSNGPFLASGYSVDGAFSARVLRASYGPMGRISLRFHPTETRREELPSVCEGRPTIVSEGFYVGRIRFRGEDGYVEVDTRRAEGALTRSRRMVCDFGAVPALPERASPSAAPKGATGPGAELVATCGGVVLNVAGGRVEGEPGPAEIGEELSMTSAYSIERLGRISITRTAVSKNFLFGGDFTFTPELDSATIVPGPPFLGSATFQRGADGEGTLTGSLSVPFPGRDVSLTGPGFDADLTPGTRLARALVLFKAMDKRGAAELRCPPDG